MEVCESDQLSELNSSPLSDLTPSPIHNSPIKVVVESLVEINNDDGIEEDELIPDSEEEDFEEIEKIEFDLLNSQQSKRVNLNQEELNPSTSNVITNQTIDIDSTSINSMDLDPLLPILPLPISNDLNSLPLPLPSPSQLLSSSVAPLESNTNHQELTASQDMLLFLSNLDPEELDFIPSSALVPEEIEEESYESIVPEVVTGNNIDENDSMKERNINNKVELKLVGEDDSGYFEPEDLDLVEGLLPVETLSNSGLNLEMDFEDDALWAELDDVEFDLLTGVNRNNSMNEEGLNQSRNEREGNRRMEEESEVIPEGFVVGFGRAGGSNTSINGHLKDFSVPSFTSARTTSLSFSRPKLSNSFNSPSPPPSNPEMNEFSTIITQSSNFIGFTSGRGAVVGPSEAALERSRKLLLGSSPPESLLSSSSAVPSIGGSRPSILPLPLLELTSIPLLPAVKKLSKPFVDTLQQGFTSGRGKALIEPSLESLKRSEEIWGMELTSTVVENNQKKRKIQEEEEEDKDKDVFLVVNDQQQNKKEKKNFNRINSYILPTTILGVENNLIDSPLPIRTRSTTTGVIEDRIPLTSINNQSTTTSSPPKQNLIEQNSPVIPTSILIPSSIIPSTPLPFKNPLLSSQSKSQTPLASTSKLPLPLPLPIPIHSKLTSLPTFRPPLLSNSNTTTSNKILTPFKSTPAIRKLNFGMTPRSRNSTSSSSGGGGKIQKFITPFKDGIRPVGIDISGISGKGIKLIDHDKGKGKGKEKEIKKERENSNFKVLFDLTPQSGRQSLYEAGIRPQTHYYEYLEDSGLSEDILRMDSVSAVAYVFPCGRGEKAALEKIEIEGGIYITKVWVSNHWSLIIWKLASLVRTQPELISTYWNWETALNQLKYRYEREINNAQRSCIKRIQEQDSPSTLPMILVVSQIRWDDPPDTNTEDLKPGEEALLIIVGLELTDGWYRIRANIDSTLKSACERGKLVVGAKLAISGARLESSRDGTEVLEALSRSSINITGNSTSLAPWYSKLGFVREPFIATLTSLTSTGGIISLLDFTIEKIFPSGFIDMNKKTDSDTWCEEEERIRKDIWERGHAKAEAKLADAQEKVVGEWDSTIEALQEATYTRNNSILDPELGDEEADELLERIELAKVKDSIIRRLSKNQVLACLTLAQENALQSRYQDMADLQEDLATSFPPRDIREFKVLRIKDFNKGKSNIDRTALLTIWEIKTVESNFLKEGQRYLLSNVVPKGSWNATTTEIALTTRRDSRWRVIEM